MNSPGFEPRRCGGCDEAQGYRFARPMPAADFERHARATLAPPDAAAG